VRIGRVDPRRPGSYNPDLDVIFSAEYTAVSRVSKPHGKFIEDGGEWYIEDAGSTGGTMVNTVVVTPEKRVAVHDGDLVELAKGIYGAKLLVIMPNTT
jgi:pSer/pThr/pTyr-binding forkhead associated (FHA) protein